MNCQVCHSEDHTTIQHEASASERWGAHLFSCEECAMGETEMDDHFCLLGARLRKASLEDMRRHADA